MFLKLIILLLLFPSVSMAQNTKPLIVTDNSSTCNATRMVVTSGTLSCAGSVATVTTGGGGGGGSPASPNKSIQFNNSGAFGGSANLIWDGTNVGIGTTIALQKLDINAGNLQLKNLVPNGIGPRFILNNSSGFGEGTIDFYTIGGSNSSVDLPSARWHIVDDGNYSANMFFETKDTGTGGGSEHQRLTIASSGFVGIGANSVTLPANQLDVETGQLSSGVMIGSEADGYAFANQAAVNGLGVEGHVNLGYVTDQGNELSVNGTAAMTGFYMATGAANNYVLTSDGIGDGTWKAATGGSGTINSGTVNRPAYYSGATTLSSGNGFYNGSNVGIGTTLNKNLLDVAGGVSIGTTYAGYQTAPSNGLIIQGNVGIGSTNPGQLLDVKGTARMTGFIDTTSPTSGYVLTSDTNGVGTWQVSSGGGGGTGANPTASVGLSAVNGVATTFLRSDGAPALSQSISPTWTGNHIFAPSSGNTVFTVGNVGIGTASPIFGIDYGNGSGLQALRINGGASGTSNGSAVYFANNSNLQSAVGGYSSINGGAFNSDITLWGGNTTNGSINFQTSNGISAVVTKTGNVGIGSINPGQLLDVFGTTRFVGSGNAYFGGNVGIGSASPIGALDVSGNVSAIGGGTLITAGSAPTVASNDCGSTSQGTVAAHSTNQDGNLTVGTLTVTSCAMTFNTAIPFVNAPFCICQDDTNVLGIKCTETTTKMTVTSTTSMSGDVIGYHCGGTR